MQRRQALWSYLLKAWQKVVELCLIVHCAGELLAARDAERPITLDLSHAPDEAADVLSVGHPQGHTTRSVKELLRPLPAS